MRKNKIVGLIAVTATSAIALSACGKSAPPAEVPANNSATSTHDAAESSNITASVDTSAEVPEVAPSFAKLLVGDKKAYLADSTGNYNEIKFTDNVINHIDKVVENEHGFFALYSIDLGDSETETRLTLLDDNGKLHDLEMPSYGWDYDLASYENNIYFSYAVSDENYNTVNYIYKFNPESTSMEICDDFDRLFGLLDDYYYGANDGVISSLASRGWFYAQPKEDNSIIYIVDKDANILRECVSGEEGYLSFWGGNKDYAVVFNRRYTEDYETISTGYMFDVNDESASPISFDIPSDDGASFIAADDDELFFYTHEDIYSYYVGQYTLYSYNTLSNTCAQICRAQSIPGTDTYNITPCADGFTFTDDYVYALIPDETAMTWHAYSAADNYLTDTALPVSDVMYDYIQYGTIDYEYDDFRDDDERIYYYYYLEKFNLKDSFPNADKINADLQEQYKSEIAYFTNDMEFYADDEFLLSSPPFNTAVYSKFDHLSDRYIQVTFSSYNYGGGAHGMPGYYRYMYDLTSGDSVQFTDLYTGTEDDFKKIVADYTSEFHKENNDYFYNEYELYEPEYIWNQYYDDAFIEMPGYFTSDSYVIEYWPYQYGPFASGFIDVPIPLEVLGIKL